MPLIEIITPAPSGSLHGNRMTALRWSGFIQQLGYSAHIRVEWSGQPVDCLIALHANRSHASISKFKQTYPLTPVVLIMTGTDIYRDLGLYPEVIESMQLANEIVVLQEDAVKALPALFHKKTRVIYQSYPTSQRQAPRQAEFEVCVIGHLRPEKDPFRAAKALRGLPIDSKIKVIHLGKSMSAEMTEQADFFNKTEPRYHWHSEVTHSAAMQYLSRSRLMVISSLMEGGAHVVSEAISIGVPVIASDIAGNRGLLGEDYSGYYEVGNTRALQQSLLRAESEPQFYDQLVSEVSARSSLTLPEREMQSIGRLLRGLL